MSKFKVGDRVVVIRDQNIRDLNKGTLMYPKGETFEICQRTVDYNNTGLISLERYFKDSDYNWTVAADDLELEHIFNSPLNQALA